MNYLNYKVTKLTSYTIERTQRRIYYKTHFFVRMILRGKNPDMILMLKIDIILNDKLKRH